MENQNPRVQILWEHSLTNLLDHDSTSYPGIALRQWVHFQGVHNILDLLSWDQEELKMFLPNRYTPLMTMVRVNSSGPTKLNKWVGSKPTSNMSIQGMIHSIPSHLKNGPNKLKQC